MQQKEKTPKEKISLACVLSCIYFLCMPLSIVSFLQNFSLLKLVSIGIGGGLVVLMFLGRSRLSFNMAHFWTIIYMLYMGFNLLLYRSEYGIQVTVGCFEVYVISILISMRLYNQREKRIIENAWLLVGLICIIMGATSSSEVGDEGRTTLTILGGSEDPNQFCAYFILPILYAIKRIATPHEKAKPLYVFYTLAAMYVVLRSGSRGGLLAVLIPALFFVIMGIKGYRERLLTIIATALAVTVFMTVIFPLLPTTLTERYSVERIAEDRGTHRLDLWEAIVADVWKDKKVLLIGGGIMHTEDILSKTIYDNTVAHNQWLQVLADQGLAGILIFGLQIASAFIRNLKDRKEASAAVLGVVALSMSLTLYVFKPYLNIILMASMTYEGETQWDLEYKRYKRLEERKIAKHGQTN